MTRDGHMIAAHIALAYIIFESRKENDSYAVMSRSWRSRIDASFGFGFTEESSLSFVSHDYMSLPSIYIGERMLGGY